MYEVNLSELRICRDELAKNESSLLCSIAAINEILKNSKDISEIKAEPLRRETEKLNETTKRLHKLIRVLDRTIELYFRTQKKAELIMENAQFFGENEQTLKLNDLHKLNELLKQYRFS